MRTCATFIVVGMACAVSTAAGCGGSDGGGGGGDGGGNGGSDAGGDAGGGDAIAGVAHVVQGPSAVEPLAGVAQPLAALVDGDWLVSPDKVRVRLDHLGFNAATEADGVGADLENCEIEYDRATPSLSLILDCPFEFQLGRTIEVLDVALHMDPASEILISDPVIGIFTDPDAPGGLATVEPAGGADFVPWSSGNGGTSAGAAFSTPLELGAGTSLSLAVVLDAVQTVEVVVTGGVPAFNATSTWVPAVVFPTLDQPGRVSYYTSAGSAGTIDVASHVPLVTARVYYDAAGEPAYAFAPNVCGVGSDSPKAAFAADPDDSPAYTDGRRTGGWLGRDPDGTLCWVLPVDSTWSSYAAYLTLPEVESLGSSATLSCQTTSSPTPPSSGSTYATGCPAITADETTELDLAAD